MIQKLTFGEKFGYGLGDMAANFIFQAMLALQLSYYTDVFGLSPRRPVRSSSWSASSPLHSTRSWVIADRTNTKWGKFRRGCWTALPFGIIGVSPSPRLTSAPPRRSSTHGPPTCCCA